MSYIRVRDSVGIQTIGQDGTLLHRNNRINMEPFFIETIGQVWNPSSWNKYGTLLLGVLAKLLPLRNIGILISVA